MCEREIRERKDIERNGEADRIRNITESKWEHSRCTTRLLQK